MDRRGAHGLRLPRYVSHVSVPAVINLVVLGAVLEADLGRRKITAYRLGVLGIVLALGAGLIFRVFRDQGIPWSQAGSAYALLWIVVIGARFGFEYATFHSHNLQVWLGTHHITADAITDALIFMAVGMLLTRTATLRMRATALPAAPDTERAMQPPSSASPAER